MKYKLVIFDFDGTLADSFPWFVGIINQVADKYRFKHIADHEIDTLRGYDARKLMKHLGVAWWKMPLIARHVRKLMAEDIHHISLFAGVSDVLKRLADDGVTLAVVSSNSQSNVLRVLGPDNAARISYFGCGVSLFGKQAKFREILSKTGISPRETLCIGDETRDILAAKSENLACGAVTWGFATTEALRAHAPNEVFANVGGILEAVY
jgi:phosphoglycolate phosphatase